MWESKYAGKRARPQVNNMLTQAREEKLRNRHLRVRKKIVGTPERPRLSVHKSHLNLYAQAVDDLAERTLLSSSTLEVSAKMHGGSLPVRQAGASGGKEKGKKQLGNVEGAKAFGASLAEALKKKKITRIVFDRGGFAYHGRIKAFAETLREHGIQF